jgi:HSP90 family molecular chaperone
MTSNIITKYLLGVASDCWHSSDFFADHPGLLNDGFSPVGRFGIGFLSVFMLDRNIAVTTQTQGGPCLTCRHLKSRQPRLD